MRPLILITLALAALAASTAEPTYPLWDGHETIAEYAKRANLEPTKTLDLGGGVKLDLVLIPAGKFMMGTPEPESPWIGGAILGITVLVALVLLAVLVVRAIRQRLWPQFSLRWLIVLVAVLGVAQYGGVRWWRAAEARKYYSRDDRLECSVSFSTPCYMGKCEVMQEQYQQVTGTNPSHFRGRDLPVEYVSWDEAQEFCRKISEEVGETVRLPSVAEWEYACRAGTRTRFCSGDADVDLGSVAWYDANSGGKTHPVGGKAPNTWGVHDMHGNVWEWCTDRVEAYKADVTPGPNHETRMVCGGSWGNAPRECRSAFRVMAGANSGANSTGFRVVVSVPKAP